MEDPRFIRIRQHQRQVRLNIWLPVGVGALVALGLAVLAIVGTVQQSSQIERWGNLSAVYLIIPKLFEGFLSLAILGGLAYGVYKLRQFLPAKLWAFQAFMVRVARMARQMANRAVRPVMKAQEFQASLQSFWQMTISLFK